MKLIFYIDPEAQQPHIHGHGVAEEEVRQVMRNRAEDRPAKNGCRSAIGRTRAGRVLRVIYTPARNEHGWFVITAYDVRGKALEAFRRRQRRRGR